MNSLSFMVVALLLAVLTWAWYANMAAREAANRAAHEACSQLQLLMLDGTVALARAWLRRGANSLLCVERTYDFEYTDDGHRRLKGFVIMRGPDVVSVGLAAARHVG